ncbi:MAG: hypothetical protein ACKOAD_06385 [Gammaproteobacteria bacterium]
MPQHRLDQVQHSDLFYRKNYYRITITNVVLTIINILVIGSILYLRWTKPEPNYYISTTDGKILTIQPQK